MAAGLLSVVTAALVDGAVHPGDAAPQFLHPFEALLPLLLWQRVPADQLAGVKGQTVREVDGGHAVHRQQEQAHGQRRHEVERGDKESEDAAAAVGIQQEADDDTEHSCLRHVAHVLQRRACHTLQLLTHAGDDKKHIMRTQRASEKHRYTMV